MQEKLLTVLLLWCFSLISVDAQIQKIEMEQRISEEAFPKDALLHLEHSFSPEKKVKYYQENSGEGESYEAKFKKNGHRFSVEYAVDGSLLDIEKQMNFSAVPETVQARINKYWNEEFKRFKILKCQEQSSSAGIRYEIEIKGYSKKGIRLYEYLFDADGTFLKKAEMVTRSNDMILY